MNQTDTEGRTELFRRVLDSSGDQILILDEKGCIVWCNHTHATRFAASFGLPVCENDPVETWLPAEVFPALAASRMGREEKISAWFGPVRDQIWAEYRFMPLSGEDPAGVTLVYIRDQSKFREREIELELATEIARADASAKSSFLSNMSHEIRTPMNAIIGLTELLMQRKMDETAMENLKAIRFSANNLLTIINDILDFSKIEAGKFSFESQTFDVLQVLDEISKSIKISAQSRNLVYESLISGNIPSFLKGDPVRLSQILLNLLGNSLKFTHTGRIRLQVEPIRETDHEVVLEFRVQDTGIGIPRESLSRIFQSFAQVHHSRRFKREGTGLGLSITKRLVEMQDGEIRVESEVGKGSVFTFFIPYRKVGPNDFQPAPADEENGTERFPEMKVLLVEDNKINQLLARQILVGWGVNVEVANDGFEAIAKLQRRSFDLILLDLQMPEIDGFEVARYVRKTIKPPANQIPIVALTADAFSETRTLTMEAGMNDFIPKPYQQKDLLRVLRRFYRHSDALSAGLEPQPEEIHTSDSSIDFDFIREKFGKDPETLRYILEVFVNEIREEIDFVRRELESGHLNGAIKPVHKLVSTFTALGMAETATGVSQLEVTLKLEENPTGVLDRWSAIERDYDEAVLKIKPVLASLTAGGAPLAAVKTESK